MVDIKISGRKVSVTDGMRQRVNEKIGDALKVFDIKPMSCDVVLRVDKNRSNPERKMCEVTVFVRDNVVRVEAADERLALLHLAADGAPLVEVALRDVHERTHAHTPSGSRGHFASDATSMRR